jgi:hypothetical protein
VDVGEGTAEVVIPPPEVANETRGKGCRQIEFVSEASVQVGLVAVAVLVELEHPLHERRFANTSEFLREGDILRLYQGADGSIAVVQRPIEVEG